MKKLIYVLYVMFAILTTITFVVAFHVNDGLVETNYYGKATGYFRAKEAERAMALSFKLPDGLRAGSNVFSIGLFSGGKPFKGAKMTLYVGNVSNTRSDASYELKEIKPGAYSTGIVIPSAGRWFFRVDVSSGTLKTDKSWFEYIT
ncbi:MAG: FixH family protein [Nitrospirae bacterium]|nr:FixH family protein [Nitrospirota bacterium]